MAGGPPRRNENSQVRGINIAVTGGGVQTGAILEGNNFQGQLISRMNYTGPPTGEGAGPVAPREQTDGTINIRNEGSQSHHPIALGNTFGGDVVLEQNINLQPPGQNNEVENEARMDLR
ncbi:hypothetical protein AMELA_G00161360 [Ameiurus melas]|uniref:Uncharacterized protein n=1 Tax=Ameiurus melas TaxID=219545 RepID=A0A7J6AFN1_AMEME|nr:hypothetical protein AMELA_G00161360 [Ameiurus melas]